MMLLCNNVLAGQRSALEFQGDRITIGRGSHNLLVLDSPLIAFDAAVLKRDTDQWRLTPVCANGCKAAGNECMPGTDTVINPGDSIEIFPFEIELNENAPTSHCADRSAETTDLIRWVHRQLLALMDIETDDEARRNNPEYLLNIEHMIEQLAADRDLLSSDKKELVAYMAQQCVLQELIEKLFVTEEPNDEPLLVPSNSPNCWNRLISEVPAREVDLNGIVETIADELKLDASSHLAQQMSSVEKGFAPACQQQLGHASDDLLVYLALRSLKKQIKDIVFRYGPLEDLLRIPSITEIMVVGCDSIFVEKSGVIESSGRKFITEDVALTVIDRIVSKVGRRIDKSQPLVDARLVDGSRVNAVIPPLAVSGPAITIRRFPKNRLKFSDLVQMGALSASTADFLSACVLAKQNMLISGGTGTGKTTLLNCLTDFIPDDERIVTIEDTAELQIVKRHVVQMEAKPANVEGRGAYSIHDLVKNSLRMRPDRIIVGECRGAEALDMLQAMNTGHEGSLTTIHANNPRDVQ